MPRFFIDRPVFAWVIALGILLGGFIALQSLPIEQYPQVAPPSLTITATYPGADAETLEENVAQVIEQQLNGVDGYLYMSSTSRSNGTAQIDVTFEAGTDIDIAQTEVQNRLSTVEARLPQEVRRQGIQVRQTASGFLMVVALVSESGKLSSLDLGDYAAQNIADELRRVSGVGDVQLFGSEYAMRIWLDPERLASYDLSPSAVLAEVRSQNSQTAGGQLGALPSPPDTELTAQIVTEGRFSSADEFEDIILRANPDGSNVRLRDVASVELGAQRYAQIARLNGEPMAGIAVQLATGANALATAEGVRERLAELEEGFPDDMTWAIPFDTTPFVSASIEAVIHTLVEAVILVFLVMFLFLQNWRATLIPTIVVPIALAGSCLGLALFGFSINVLTLFGMVLAIGILVDDAIIVIENVERIMSEEGLPPKEATRKAMDQITGAIVGITLVLAAVFIPMAFFPGSTGGIYRQFSVTLAISILFSALLALTLTPALCATFLKHQEKAAADSPGLLRRFFNGFDRGFQGTTRRYDGGVARLLAAPLRVLGVFVLLAGLTAVLFLRLPGGFLPTEDQGTLITAVQAPPGATRARTNEAMTEVENFWIENEAVANTIGVRGFSFFGQGQNMGMVFTSLKPWEEREASAEELLGRAMGTFASLDSAMAFTINPPAIQQLGNASGFSFKLEDRGGLGRDALQGAQGQLLGAASQSPLLTGVRPEGQPDAPQLRVNIDRIRARALGLSMDDINQALSITFGSAYVNDFTREGRVKQVLLQARAEDRVRPEDVMSLRLPNSSGDLVPFSAFADTEWTAGPPQIQRYNGYPNLTISGMSAPGVSSGEALAEMERLAAEILPQGLTYEWTGISFEEKQAGNQIALLLALSIVVVFLILSALYESWSIPVSVLLIVPLGVLGAVLFSMLRGLSADVYFNVGLITIIGLAAKNAILIVEFAIEAEDAGKSPMEAVKEAASLRLRPIIMTSLAFILGMVPLATASGASAASQIAVGTGVMGGMVFATALGIFFIPVLYLLVRRYLSKKTPDAPAPETASAGAVRDA
ncbi:hydrophobe/amphiphile efflux-1 family RND transporter [Pacificimonas flava]|uniref:Efflux pump membrane transporter n=2 Tax=Pacificimonas TaxID=1960290 RepID=A0A219B0U8_9SPHN|nr:MULTISPECIES: efflux RND transporter permease subunit [Pacificimonas]MBZ6379598.1 multidrug efflux RND transporter permease subunit [Pacificimonas aurantium]OWV31930.1 hydrophobe/amphiphile efflux-1 family RND transporter [Pacificimonas flava]